MVRASKSQRERLSLLIVAASPPRKILAELDYSGNDSAESASSSSEESLNLNAVFNSSHHAKSRKHTAMQPTPEAPKVRAVSTVEDVLSKVFSALWANFVETSAEFKDSCSLRHPPERQDGLLLSEVFSSERLMQRPGANAYRLHSELMRQFGAEQKIKNWEANSAVKNFKEFLKQSDMVQELWLGLRDRLLGEGYSDARAFVDRLAEIWFQPLHNGRRCGYHHVCMGEVNSSKRTVSGMHSWFRLLLLEEGGLAKLLDWSSYTRELHLANISFGMRRSEQDAWCVKPRSSLLLGTPTDFDLLLLTSVALLQPRRPTRICIKGSWLSVVQVSDRQSGAIVTSYVADLQE